MKKNMMKMVSLILAMVMLLALAGCGAAPSETKAPDAPTSTDNGGSTASAKNKLAFFLPMTGDQMQYGESLSHGAKLALKQ